jgi:signal transduction histidine kinase
MFAFVLTVVLSVGGVAWTVSTATRSAFEQRDGARTAALVAQFRREFERRGDEVLHRLQGIADDENTLRMAIDLSRPNSDASLYYSDALGLSKSHQLDFLEIVNDDGRIISSAHFAAKFGYMNEWVIDAVDWKDSPEFLMKVETPTGVELALMGVRTVRVSDKKIYIVGGKRLDKDFLASLPLPEGMRALLYRNLEASFSPDALTDANGPIDSAARLAPLVEKARNARTPAIGQREDFEQIVTWTPDAASAESFHAMPLRGRSGELLGVLLVGSSRKEMVLLNQKIQTTALLVGAGGILLGMLLSIWVSARVTRPVRLLATGAREVAAGRWNVRVKERGSDEIAELARTFNQMTQQLVEQRDRLVSTERVAAWRELARRLAHELKNPLFPLQITIENLQRAREGSPQEFEEIFRESTGTLLAELENLKTIVGRFSDFAKMPAPDLKSVDINAMVRHTVRVFDAQFNAPGRPAVTPELYLQENLGMIQADPDLLHRMLQNLVLNAMDAMPAGGTLTMRTRRIENGVQIEVADTGQGLSREECERLFTPYYTTKQHGTGLGLAIVQSVVSDHKGRIAVESEPGHGTTFRIALPARPDAGVKHPEKTRAEAEAPAKPVRKEAPPVPDAETVTGPITASTPLPAIASEPEPPAPAPPVMPPSPPVEDKPVAAAAAPKLRVVPPPPVPMAEITSELESRIDALGSRVQAAEPEPEEYARLIPSPDEAKSAQPLLEDAVNDEEEKKAAEKAQRSFFRWYK